jgi:hypothetical protein
VRVVCAGGVCGCTLLYKCIRVLTENEHGGLLLSCVAWDQGWASAGRSTLSGNVFLNNSQCNICFEDAEKRGSKNGVHTWHGSTSSGLVTYSHAPSAN